MERAAIRYCARIGTMNQSAVGRRCCAAWLRGNAAHYPVHGKPRLAGVTAFDGAEGGPVPTTLVAVTVKVYDVPLVNPVTTWLVPVVPALLSTPPAGFEVTV